MHYITIRIKSHSKHKLCGSFYDVCVLARAIRNVTGVIQSNTCIRMKYLPLSEMFESVLEDSTCRLPEANIRSVSFEFDQLKKICSCRVVY